MTSDQPDTAAASAADKFDDEHYPAYTMGRAAEIVGVSQDFLRRLGDAKLIDGFRDRVMARLVLVPPHDPQFRRNRERVVRDAERENLLLDWDLGIPEDEGS